jgi:FlaA1/EpsC-like NDP-sugar epimerase
MQLIERLNRAVSGKAVLLTGAGGSIGSAFAAAVIRFNPRHLILFDHAERNLHQVDLELKAVHDRGACTSVLGDICDEKLVSKLLRRYKPEIVLHAAAFKHVPLMEENPFAAVRNNALGTNTLAKLSQAEGVATFVMISTDKAVNPISIMGASKRVAELALLHLNSPRNRMSAVRLGNVLRSHGSVVPTFLRQILHGGPVTVTHENASRYFLTIDESVELILVALTREIGGIFVPPKRDPIRIVDLAQQLIRTNQLEPPREIAVTFIGLRPGDKISEQFLFEDEFVEHTTEDDRLLRIQTTQKVSDRFGIQMKELARSVNQRDLPSMMDVLREIVPTYRPTDLLKREQKRLCGLIS